MSWKSSEGNILGNFSHLKAELSKEGHELLWATNGGMFSPELKPVGWYVENGVAYHKIERDSGYGNFHLLPNGAFGILKSGKPFVVQTDSLRYTASLVRYATQSGPMLVIDGQLHPAFNEGSKNKYVRSGVGIDSAGKVVFAISQQPTNFYTFATLFRDRLKCANALYLDGAISKMYNTQTERNEDGRFGVMIGLTR